MLNILNSATISESYTNYSQDDIELSEIFPGDNMISVIQTKSVDKLKLRWYILLREQVPVDFEYFGTIYKDIGVPRTLFAVQVSEGRIIRFKVVCVKDRFITDNTKIYAYPFSNVSTVGDVCLGNNFDKINVSLDNTMALAAIPEKFFAMPNTEHNYGHNKSGLYYRDLLTQLQGVPFNEEWLQDTGIIYKNFISTLK